MGFTKGTGEPRANRRRAIVVGVVAVFWYFALSGWLGVETGSPVVTRIDTFFNGDTLRWLEGLEGSLPLEFSLRHPLKAFTWVPLGQSLRRFFALAVAQDAAVVLAGRVLNAIVAGFGVGCLAWVTTRGRRPGWSWFVALGIYLLFSAGALVTVPEHFGLSNGLLSATFLLAASTQGRRAKVRLLAITAVVVGGLTLTNVLYPLGAILLVFRRKLPAIHVSLGWPVVVAAGLAALAVVIGVGARAASHSRGSNSVIARSTNLRLLADPAAALVYSMHGLIDPAVAPLPRVDRASGRISYEPIPLWPGSWGGLVGHFAWAVLLAAATGACLRDARGRRLLLLLVPWVMFNLLFHNLWGDEFFLYSPHWSWALGAVLLAGAGRLPAGFVAVLAVPILAAQLHTLNSYRNALAVLSGPG